MGIKTFSIGASGKNKKPKREINVTVKPRHLVYSFLGLIGFVMCIFLLLNHFGLTEINKIELSCDDGTKEEVILGQEYYCGDHYTILNGTIPKQTFNNLEEVIQHGTG